MLNLILEALLDLERIILLISLKESREVRHERALVVARWATFRHVTLA